MELLLKRKYLKEGYTIGHIYINGVYECDTLEDKVRELKSVADKVYGKTAIPYGRYRITLDVKSPKFGNRPAYKWCEGRLPRLLNVPFFNGVLIHSGNYADSTDGCILVGENKERGKVLYSMTTLKVLYDKLDVANCQGEEIWLTIE